jgi:urease beta subunit
MHVFPCALHYDRSLAGIRRAFIPAFVEIGFGSGEQTWVNLAANRAARFDPNQTRGAPFMMILGQPERMCAAD